MAAASRPQEHAHHAAPGPRRVDAADERHHDQHQQPDGRDAQLDDRVDAQRVRGWPARTWGSSRLPRHMPPMNVPSRTPSEMADDADHELEQLEPDHFVDERGAAAADEEQEQDRKRATTIHQSDLGIGHRDRRAANRRIISVSGGIRTIAPRPRRRGPARRRLRRSGRRGRGCTRRRRPASSNRRRTACRVWAGGQPTKSLNWSKPPIMQTREPTRRLASAIRVSPPIDGGVNVSMASGPMSGDPLEDRHHPAARVVDDAQARRRGRPR